VKWNIVFKPKAYGGLGVSGEFEFISKTEMKIIARGFSYLEGGVSGEI